MEIFSRDGIDYNIEDCSVGEIFNYNEVLVLETMRTLFKENNSFCQCPICLYKQIISPLHFDEATLLSRIKVTF